LLITKSQTERQQCNRAFAAEFLSPSHLLSKRISGSVIDREEVENLATEFSVSSFVIEHQLKNHKLVEEIIDIS
jgi:Zn-dependent peptidase ImmA (M78 family)